MNKQERLKELIERNKELDTIVSMGFKTQEELNLYRIENIEAFNEHKSNTEKIKAITWELKTPEEKAELEEYHRLHKLKRQGKSII